MTVYLGCYYHRNKFPKPWFSISQGGMEGVPTTIDIMCPTWEMVTGVKSYLGVEKFQNKPPMDIETFTSAYLALMLKNKAATAHLIKRLPVRKEVSLFCFCKPLPASMFYAIPQPTNEECHEWFCHRLLVYHLIKSWRPELEVILR